ncbi:MAG: hypothetical protein J6A77_06040 [Lachnospiraceae bacterium]|nr:hypothetical protein [Lachnospiraceae bacterium]
MKKTFALFLCLMICGIAAFCILPGYILEEADQVRLTEQVVSGDPSIVEGVTVTTYSHYNRRLLWSTVCTFGEGVQAETEYRFAPAGEAVAASSRFVKEEYCLKLVNRLNGGWRVGSTRGLSIDDSHVTIRGMEAAFSELAAVTKAGEEKTARISLVDYMTYYPVNVVMNAEELADLPEEEELNAAYAAFFKIPVAEEALYEISIEKNKNGDIVSLGGSDLGYGVFHWDSVSAMTETDFYFTFHPYASGGVRVDTSLIPGGFGIYRQPYVIQGEERIVDPSQVELVYPLEDEIYDRGNLYLGINTAGQLVILTDSEAAICLQVVDVNTMELVQKEEYARPEGSTRFEGVIRVEEDFILLDCGQGYVSLIDWQPDRGYEQQFMILLDRSDPLYWRHNYVNQNDMDWDGERLLFACYSADDYSIQANCNMELSVYDKTGKIYYGKYLSSLMTEQEYTGNVDGAEYVWQDICEARTNFSLEVTWP